MTNGAHEKVSWDNHERLVRLETKHEHIADKVEDMAAKVDEMHELLLQAKGIRWLIIVMATLGGFIASKIGSFFPWAGK
jgi:predicted esterase YcpF (UPF0227 family)